MARGFGQNCAKVGLELPAAVSKEPKHEASTEETGDGETRFRRCSAVPRLIVYSSLM